MPSVGIPKYSKTPILGLKIPLIRYPQLCCYLNLTVLHQPEKPIIVHLYQGLTKMIEQII